MIIHSIDKRGRSGPKLGVAVGGAKIGIGNGKLKKVYVEAHLVWWTLYFSFSWKKL